MMSYVVSAVERVLGLSSTKLVRVFGEKKNETIVI